MTSFVRPYKNHSKKGFLYIVTVSGDSIQNSVECQYLIAYISADAFK